MEGFLLVMIFLMPMALIGLVSLAFVYGIFRELGHS